MESSSSNSKERELPQMQLEERQLYSNCMARTPFKKFFDSKEVNASDFHNKSWQKHFKDYTKQEPETYRRNLLRFLDELDHLIDKRVIKYRELQMKEREVQAIKEIEKRLKEREIQQQESLVIEGTTFEDNLSTDGTTLDASSVIEGAAKKASLVPKGVTLDDNLVAQLCIVDFGTLSE
ncbi:hypothetical protein Tco_1410492 [Tanacetum coccineum]